MIDSLEMMRSRIEARGYIATQGLVRHGYGVVTVHRPSNVDDLGKLAKIVDALVTTAARMPIVFPVHPRTRQRLDASGLSTRLRTATGIRLLDPLGYIDFMSAVFDCAFVITDSGGIQEETTYLGIPCLTLRDSTERPITVTHGTNRLLCAEDLAAALGQILSGDWPKGSIPEGWDGRAAEKAVASLRTVCAGSANARRASLVKANPLPRIQSADPAR
jgi:UDP-N-acetylglucosamine 2-epimerase (non-hydrolysing)